MFNRQSEVRKKEVQLRQLASQLGLEGFCLSRAINFSWFTGGGTNRVVTGSETGAAALVILQDKKFIVAPRNEMPRMLEEQVVGLGFEPCMYEWYENREQIVRTLIGKKTVGSDIPFANLKPFVNEINQLRYSLTTEEIEKVRWLGEVCSREAVATSLAIQPGMTEWEIAADLTFRLEKLGVRCPVLLVGVDHRALHYRHPVVSDNVLKKYALIALVAEKWGLHMALTRCVHFGPVPEQLAKYHEIATDVEAAFLSACAAGADSQTSFEAGLAAYAQAGLPEEWKLHHQGGPTGYQSREYRCGEGTPEPYHDNQLLAWNPTVQGTKCEDTVLYKKNGSLEFLTSVPSWWPTTKRTISGKTVLRPLILER